MKASNREHEGKILFLRYLKGKQQLPRYAKATNSPVEPDAVKNTHCTRTDGGFMQCPALRREIHGAAGVFQWAQADLAPAELWFQGNLFHHH